MAPPPRQGNPQFGSARPECACQRLLLDTGAWHLAIEATRFVTHETFNVWTGTEPGGPVPLAALTVEAV